MRNYLLEAAGVEPSMPLKTRRFPLRHGLKRPKSQECRIDCTFTVPNQPESARVCDT
jgi:hypothetical protein